MERESVVVMVREPESVAGEAVEVKGGLGEKTVEKCSCVIDVKCSDEKWKEGNKEEEVEEMICRICHLSSDQAEFDSDLIKLGCGCKGEIGIAHVHCGEAWFRLKGNRTCEICGESAKNITGIQDNHPIEEWNDNIMVETNPEPSRPAGCWRGQPFCNFLMACLVIAFVLPWFFRVKMF